MLYAHWAFKNTTYALSALSIMYAGDVLRVKCKSVVDMSKPMLINISSSSPNDRSSRIKFKSTSYVSAAGWPHAVSRPSKASRNRGVFYVQRQTARPRGFVDPRHGGLHAPH